MRSFSKACGVASVAAFVLINSSSVSPALTTLSSFNVQLTITAACTVDNTTADIDFGTQGILAANVDNSASTLDVTCTNTTPYQIGLDAGAGAGATVAVRKMTGPALATIDYSLYTDAPGGTVWGNTLLGDTKAAVGSGLAQTHILHARVPVQLTPAPGVYTDLINVTVTF